MLSRMSPTTAGNSCARINANSSSSFFHIGNPFGRAPRAQITCTPFQKASRPLISAAASLGSG